MAQTTANELDLIAENLKDLGLQPETQPIAVYHYQTSLYLFAGIGLVAAIIGWLQPLFGFLLTAVAFFFLTREFVRPFLARVKSTAAQNLSVTIPARSKEFQKTVVIIPLAEPNVLPSNGLSENTLYWLTLGLGMLTLISQLLKAPLGSLVPAGLLLIIAYRLSMAKVAVPPVDSASVVELAAVLTKARPATTTVTLLFTGSSALNSGLLPLVQSLKGSPELTYVVNLMSTAAPNPQLVASEGPISYRADAFLQETLVAVAGQKGIALDITKSRPFSKSIPLKAGKYRTITLALPQSQNPADPGATKNLRELLVGLIRQIEA